MNLVLAIAEFVGAGLLIKKAISGDTWHQLVTGTAGAGAAGAGAVPAGPAPQVQGQVSLGQLRQVGAPYGWSGSQLSDWMQIIGLESGGNPNAVNSSTTAAYGIGQFFASAPNGQILPRSMQIALNREKYVTYGGNPNTVIGQLKGMAGYIKQAYGNPAAALRFHLANGHY